MEDVSIAEMFRRVEKVERRQSTIEDRFVLQAVYVRDMNEIRNDIVEIKDGQKWATRGILGLFIAVLADVLVRLITSAPG